MLSVVMSERQPGITSDDPDALRARIAELESQLGERERELRAREADVRTREGELLEAMTDSVTGLRGRVWMYRALNRSVERALTAAGCADLEHATDTDAALRACDGEALRTAGPSVLMADVAYLGFVNLAGHAAGDILLKGVGDAARRAGSAPVDLPDRESADAPVTFYRHGGDEFGALLRGTGGDVRETAAAFRTAVAATDMPSLASRGLSPNVDVGIAHTGEGIEALRLLVANGVDVPSGERVGKIADFTVAIADRRASIQKGVDRIRMLVRFRREHPEEYAKIVPALRKGAYGIDDATVDAFMVAEDGGEDIEPRVRSYIVERSDAEFRAAQGRREREYEVVKTIADRARG